LATNSIWHVPCHYLIKRSGRIVLKLRQKLSLGFGGLLAIILVVSFLSILQITRLGESVDVILRENYRSVIACQEMKEALERMDSAVLFSLLGYSEKANELILKNEPVFEDALRIELNNITIPGEGEKAAHLQEVFKRYRSTLRGVVDVGVDPATRKTAYFSELLPLFEEIKGTADQILRMNQQNMRDANDRARRIAKSARERMYVLLFVGTLVAIGFIFFTERWILRPIKRLIVSAEEIKHGNLDLVIQSSSRDEIGQLSEAFNEMAAGLREFRRSDRAKLARIERATQQAFKSLPDAVALIDLEGKVEVATETARDVFGLKPTLQIKSQPFAWMADLYDKALSYGRPIEAEEERRILQHFVNGEERYFHPQAVPILDNEMQPTGVILLLQDVTQYRQQDEMKKDLISTASHQLKTPLTSIRMAIHLLLEERVGALTEKQVELLLAAREDSDRLHNIVNNLLDIGRIESGRAEMQFQKVSPHVMTLDAIEPFRRPSEDQGVTMNVELPADLPEVWVDPHRVNHVFANLLSNALKYTSPGGKVTVSAWADDEAVHFSVADTGKGIPEKYLPRIFEQFFRVPEQGKETGAGLGLAIVKQIVEAHGGTVGVESQAGKETTFTFTLLRADQVPKKESLS
jgi:two-component system, NtrC family, sensor histidine kinase KinB